MAANKVTINTVDGEETLIDLTSDTVTPETLAEGETAHDASGNVITGTMSRQVKWGDVLNKPFNTTYSTTLVCDGGTAGLVHVGDWYKVSDVLPATGDLTNGITVDLGFTATSAAFTEVSDDVIALTAWNNVFAVIIRSANTIYNDLTFPEPGIYYEYNLMGGRTTYLTVNNYACFPTDKLKPTSLPTHSHSVNDLTDTDQLVEDVVAKTGIDIVPNYVVTEAEEVISKVIEAQSGRTFTFATITDMHYGSWGYYEGITDYPDGVKHACQALKYIDERIKLDAVAVLGDYTDGMADTQQSTAVYDFKGVNAVLDKLRFAPNLRLVGNHDFHTEHSPLTYRYIGAYSDDNVEWGNFLGGYFRKDFTTHKIRVICLNTSEQNNTSVSPTTEQYNWFINSLDLSAKEDASEWQILILSHIPLDFWANNGEYKFPYILNAYQTGGTWSDSNGVSCDFSTGNNGATLICNIHGHVHNFKVDKLFLDGGQANVWRMATPNACFGLENKDYTGYQEDTAYTKTADSATDTAFCIYCINLDDYTIKAICYGAGYDRELTYKTAIINQLPISTDANGNIYNGKGYKENTRWSGSSQAEQDYTGRYLTGYVPIPTTGGKCYLKDITTTSDFTLWYFWDKGNFVQKVTSTADLPNVTYDESGNVASFDLTTDKQYIRIECTGIGDDSIITIDEPIE